MKNKDAGDQGQKKIGPRPLMKDAEDRKNGPEDEEDPGLSGRRAALGFHRERHKGPDPHNHQTLTPKLEVTHPGRDDKKQGPVQENAPPPVKEKQEDTGQYA